MLLLLSLLFVEYIIPMMREEEGAKSADEQLCCLCGGRGGSVITSNRAHLQRTSLMYFDLGRMPCNVEDDDDDPPHEFI